jgi:spermidine/putrescine transport system substrate-binding protein
MTDQLHPGPTTIPDPMHRRLSRRSFLRASGGGLAALSLSGFLVACSKDGSAAKSESSSFDWSAQKKTGSFTFVNWPLYVDKEKVNGEVVHPSFEAFTKDTGITIDYLEQIDDYASFFGKIQPQLADSVPTEE